MNKYFLLAILLIVSLSCIYGQSYSYTIYFNGDGSRVLNKEIAASSNEITEYDDGNVDVRVSFRMRKQDDFTLFGIFKGKAPREIYQKYHPRFDHKFVFGTYQQWGDFFNEDYKFKVTLYDGENLTYKETRNGVTTIIGCTSGDCVNGQGTQYYLDGSYYVGSFWNGLREGYGTYFFGNGENYNGHWKQGEILINNQTSNATNNNESISSTNVVYGVLAAGAIIYGLYEMFKSENNKSKNTSANNNSKTKNEDYAPKSMGGVEILGFDSKNNVLTLGHNLVNLIIRNKNTHDVHVKINFKYRGGWSNRTYDTQTYKVRAGESKEIYTSGKAWSTAIDVKIISVR